MGPLAGAVIELLKNILHLVTYGTTTGGIGELSNFFIGCAFAVPAGIFYRKRKTRKSAVLGMAAGTLLMVIMGCLSNAFVHVSAVQRGYGNSHGQLYCYGNSHSSGD